MNTIPYTYTYTQIIAIIVLSFVAASCRESTSFNSRDGVSNKKLNTRSEGERKAQSSGEQTSSTSTSTSDEQVVSSRSFALQITTAAEAPKTQDKLQLVFLLDNSPSMSDDIGRLRTSLPTLLSKLDSEKVNYETRVLTMDSYLDQIQTVGNAYYPLGQSPEALANFDRGAKNALYSETSIFSSANEITPLLQKLDQITNTPKMIDNEPGLCLGMDYLNWLNAQPASFSGKFNANDKVHFIVLSDEDNASSIETYDRNTYSLVSSKSLYCFAEKKTSTSCSEQRYDRTLSYQSYCYSYRKPNTTMQHQGTYTKQGLCHAQGLSDGQNDIGLVKLSSTKYCGQNAYSCTKSVRNPQFQCNLGSTVVKSASNKAGLKSCTVPNAYNCAAAATQYQCVAGQPGSPVYSQQTLSSPITNRQRCEVAQQFECREIYDSQEFWVAKDRSAALSTMKTFGNARCRVVDQAGSWAIADIEQGSTEPGLRSCQVYSCAAEKIPAKLARSAAITFMQGGGSCTASTVAADNSVQEFPVAQAETYLSSCQAYTNCQDISTNTIQTFAQVPEANRGQYDACSAQPVTNLYNSSKAHTVSVNASNLNSINSVNQVACAAGYNLVDGPSYVVTNAADVCPAGVPPTLPVGIAVAASGNISPKTLTGQSYSRSYATQKTSAQIASELSSGLKYAVIKMNNDLTIQNAPTGSYTSVSGADGCFTYQAYPEGHALRSQVEDFVETHQVYTNAVDDGSLIVPPTANRNAQNPVLEAKNYNPNGRYSEQVCGTPNVTSTSVSSTPSDVNNYIRQKYPHLPITWHAIVYKAGGTNCGTVANAGASEGSQYSEMSRLSGGVSSSICADSFNSFFDSLSQNVLQEVVVRYAIPDAYKSQQAIRVYNSTTDKLLTRDVDYWVSGGFITFDKAKVNPDDEISVWMN